MSYAVFTEGERECKADASLFSDVLVVFRAILSSSSSHRGKWQRKDLLVDVPLGAALVQLVLLAVCCGLESMKDQEKQIPFHSLTQDQGFLKNYKLVLFVSILE